MSSIVVTGASSGIGKATALRLAGADHRVFATVRSHEDALEISDRADGDISIVELELTDPDSISAAAGRIENAVGPQGLDALVNNAGIPVPGPLEVLPLEDLRRQLEVNLVGQLAVAQALLPAIRRARGRIVFVSSLGGRVAFPFAGAYHASKHALEAIGESLRQELRPAGIEVILVEPGTASSRIWEKAAVRTRELIAALPSEQRSRYEEDLESFEKRMGDADERGMDADKVAGAIEDALTSSRPSARYPVGAQARVLAPLRPLIPDGVFDRLASRAIRG